MAGELPCRKAENVADRHLTAMRVHGLLRLGKACRRFVLYGGAVLKGVGRLRRRSDLLGS